MADLGATIATAAGWDARNGRSAAAEPQRRTLGIALARNLDGALWAGTLLLSALLSFSVEPMIARMLLPRLGGAPAVWVVSLLFFQVALLVGYLWAHLLARLRSLPLQVGLHAALLLAAAAELPPGVRGSPIVDGPALATVVALAGGVGLPFVALSATSPLLQHWFARSRANADPYVLYAASNGGSLLGLLAYPFALEPLLGLSAQAWLWSATYAAGALLVGTCAVRALYLTRAAGSGWTARAAGLPRDAIGRVRYLRWIGLAALPSAWLGASTTYLTTAVAPVPLLWVLPLAAYLLTLILAFAPTGWWRWLGLAAWLEKDEAAIYLYRRRSLVAGLAVAAAGAAVASHALEPLPLVVLAHVVGLFAGALVCHSALAADRPGAGSATAYYLALAIGGALGGAFAAVAAPLLFPTPLEYPVVIALFWASGLVRARSGRRWLALVPVGLAALATWPVAAGSAHWFITPFLLGAASLLALGAVRLPALAAATLLGVLLVADATPVAGGYRLERVERSFFGVNRVLTSPDGSQRVLLNGLISHGTQSLDPGRATSPEGYYTRVGPLGDILRAHQPADGPVERIGVVGLGAGTIACYADPERAISFFEIDPTVIGLANDPSLFTYLSRCPPAAVVEGDGRLSLEKQPPGSLDVLVVDAYSGDSMPLHLLTREAMGVYRRVLGPGGVLALHISNRFFDLEPLVAALADDAGLVARVREDGISESEAETQNKRDPGWTPSVWTLVGPEQSVEQRLAGATGWRELRRQPGLQVWTDDYANPLAVRR